MTPNTHQSPRRLRDRVGRPHDPVDDPGLAPDLGHDPARLQRDDRADARQRDRPQEPLASRAGRACATRRSRARRRAGRGRCRSRPSHRRRGEASYGRRLLVVGDLVEPGDDRVRAEPDQEGVEPGDADAALDLAVGADPADVLGLVGPGLVDALHRRRTSPAGRSATRARRGVADEELDRGRDRGDGEGDEQPEPVVAVRAAAQHADRVDRGEQEAGDHVGGQEHVENS